VKICPLHDQTPPHEGMWRRGSIAPCIPNLIVGYLNEWPTSCCSCVS